MNMIRNRLREEDTAAIHLNIVIKITEGVWTDGNFIELTDTNSIGYEVERSMVQYVVATWKPMTFTYWGVSKYNHHNYYYRRIHSLFFNYLCILTTTFYLQYLTSSLLRYTGCDYSVLFNR